MTELETKKGLIDLIEPNKQCLCFIRTIKDIEEHMKKKNIGNFIDVKPSKRFHNKINMEPQKLLYILKDKLKHNIKQELVSWYFTLH